MTWYKSHFDTESIYVTTSGRVIHKVLEAVAKGWKADGAILHINRGCTMQALTAVEDRKALVEAGIPAIAYEGNDADPRDLDMVKVKKQVDTFLESLSIKKLKEES